MNPFGSLMPALRMTVKRILSVSSPVCGFLVYSRSTVVAVKTCFFGVSCGGAWVSLRNLLGEDGGVDISVVGVGRRTEVCFLVRVDR